MFETPKPVSKSVSFGIHVLSIMASGAPESASQASRLGINLLAKSCLLVRVC